jgi:hypothetical protein
MDKTGLEYQKLYRIKTNNLATKKYEKTKKGFLVRLYRNMQSRVTGVQKIKHHLYAGKDLLPRDEFYQWALSSDRFHELFESWELLNYERRFTPSVDRIDSRLGYSIGNIEWVEFKVNCSRSSKVKLNIMARLNDIIKK